MNINILFYYAHIWKKQNNAYINKINMHKNYNKMWKRNSASVTLYN